MTGSTRVTIGMPLFNNAATVRRALESLLSQSYRHFTIVASDDKSSDGTAGIVEAYINNPQVGKNVTFEFLKSEENSSMTSPLSWKGITGSCRVGKKAYA